MALRLQIEYKDINDVDTRIEVHQADYYGPVEYREYASNEAACEVEWGDSSGKRLPVVYGSQVTLRFDAEVDYEFLDFFTSNSRKNKIEVYKNDELFHVSFGEADTWSEPLSAAPYEVSFSGYDGLGLLSDEDFLDGSKNYYEGEMTPLEILLLILAKTGLELNLNTAVGIRAVGAGGGDALTTVIKDLVSYRAMNCYEVLEQVFQGCRIFQRDAEWYVVSNDKWENENFSCYRYAPDGSSLGTKSVNTRFDGFWFEGEGSLEFLPAMKEMVVKQDFGLRSNLLENNDFSKITNGTFDGWEAVGLTAKQLVLDDDGNKYVYLSGTDQSHPWDTTNRTKYLRSNPVRVTATDKVLNLSVSYALSGLNGTGWMFFGLHLVGNSNTHYALRTLPVDPAVGAENKELKYYWEINPNNLGVPLKGYVNEFRHKFSLTWHREVKNLEIPATIDVVNNFTTFEAAVLDGLPEAGQLSLYLYLPRAVKTDIFGAAYSKVAIFFTDQDEGDLPTQRELVIINDAKNNYVPEDLDFVNGDLPDYPGNTVIYNGGFLLPSGMATLAWGIDGVIGNYSYTELIGRFIASEMRLARQSYQAVLADSSPGTALVFVDPLNNNRKFVEAGITYNDRMATIDGRYVELKGVSLSGFVVKESTEFIKPAKETSSGNKAPTERELIDLDEKVGFVNLEADEFEFEPGYLDRSEWVENIDGLRPVFQLIPPRSNTHSLPTGTHRIDFLHAFPEYIGTNYSLFWQAMDGDYLVGSRLVSKDFTGFEIEVKKNCVLNYYANKHF